MDLASKTNDPMTTAKPDIAIRHYTGHEFNAIRDIAIDLYREAFAHESIGRRIHDELLATRSEQRVTIATHHGNTHARNTYTRWGYHHIGTRQPTPPAPLLDVYLRSREC